MSEDVDDTLPAAATAEDRPRRHSRLDTSLTRGSVVGRYLLLDELGAGGMGVVWAAYDPELHRRVAVKLMQPRADASSGGHARMLREAQALAQLSHPNVVAVYDVGSFQSRVFLAMELVEGETLGSWLRTTTRSWKEAVAMLVAAGRGLAAAHAAGLVHRDFKPSNVLVGNDGRVRVLDFGIARAAHESGSVVETPERGSRNALQEPITMTGSVMGTPLYMAPEALRGDVVGPAGDQFSFCVALYEALYGQLPFGERTSGDELPALRAPPSDRDVPSWLHRAVVRGLDLRPDYRYQSMDALLAAIADDPAVRRRRVAAVLAGVATLAALVVSAMAWRTHVRAEQRRNDPCADSAPLAGVWNETARAQLDAVFHTRGGQAGDAAFARVASGLDAASLSLTEVRARICAATRVEHVQPEEVLRARLACLDDQRDHLAALIDKYEQLPANALDQAAYSIGRLPSPGACTESRSVAVRDVPPITLVPRVAALRARLLDMWVRDRTTRDGVTADEIRRVLADAKQLGYPPVIAEVELELCMTGNAANEQKAMVAACQDAVTTAVAAHLDAQAALATALRAYGGAVTGVAPEVERRWLDEAAAWVARVGDPASEYQLWEARAFSTTSVDEAIADHQHALDLAVHLWGEDSDVAQAKRSMLAWSLALAGRFDEAIVIQERAAQGLERTFGPRGAMYADLLDNYGCNLQHVGRFAEARAALERALATPGVTEVAVASVRCDLARVDLSEGHIDAAIAEGERGVAEMRAKGVVGMNLAINEDPLAAAYLGAKRYEDARELAHSCVDELATDGGRDRIEQVPCLAIEGDALFELGKPSEAAARLERAFHLLEGKPAAPGLRADVQFHLARALVAARGDHARAAELVTSARAELTRYPFLHSALAELDAWTPASR